MIGALTGLAAKFLGGGTGDLAKLLESFQQTRVQARADRRRYLPKALAFIRSHLPADLVEQILAKIPALAQFVKPGAGAE